MRFGAAPEAVADEPPLPQPSRLKAAGIVLVWALFAWLVMLYSTIALDRNLRSRVSYAIAETDDARRKIAAFRQRERRWPGAAELNLPEWTPYRDGSEFLLLQDGRVRITFSVMRGLKGHGITLSLAAPSPGH